MAGKSKRRGKMENIMYIIFFNSDVFSFRFCAIGGVYMTSQYCIWVNVQFMSNMMMHKIRNNEEKQGALVSYKKGKLDHFRPVLSSWTVTYIQYTGSTNECALDYTEYTC